jgi:hypothetical protein
MGSVAAVDVVTLVGLTVSVAAGCVVGSTVASVVAAVVALGTEVWLGATVGVAAADPQAAKTHIANTLNPIFKISRRNTLFSINLLTSFLSGNLKHQQRTHFRCLPPPLRSGTTVRGRIYHAKLNRR